VFLEVEGLAKHFTRHILDGRRLPAFDDVSFALGGGECLLVRGPSGAGKSSLLKCLYRTYRPSSGQALLRFGGGECDLATAPDVDVFQVRQAAIGYVSQFFAVIPRVSAVGVVAEPLLTLGIEAGRARRQAREMLERLEVAPALWEGYPSTFSGGERQRVNLARALVAPRELLLLDEPTSSLDPGRARLVCELLAERKRAGTGMIAVFHDLVTPALIDHVYEMERSETTDE